MRFNKIISLILLTVVFLSKGFSQEKLLEEKISITFEKVKLKDALKKIEQQSEISFAYKDFADLEQMVSAKFTNKEIGYILNELFKYSSLSYKLIGGKVTIYEVQKEKGKQTVHGYVYDKSTGEVLIGATVYDKKTFKGSVSNQFGFFSLTLPSGDYTLSVSFLGYESQEVNFTKDTSLVVNLAPQSNNIEEVVVQAKKDNDFVTSSGLGKMTIETKSIKEIPSLGGEADMLKAISLLPGIKQGTDGSAGFYVRGGGADQNLLLLDGVPLYNPYHLWGYLSTFNADAVNNVEVTKGTFPARYGGRLSSVVDVSMNDGNNQEWEKKISVGLLSGKASISGPLKKDVSSLFFSVRRTYADLLIAPFYALEKNLNNSRTQTGYNFTDFNLKTNYRFSDKNRLYLSAYYSKDKMYNNKTEYDDSPIKYEDKSKHQQGWGNAIVALRWNHLFSNRLFVNTTVYYTGYNYFTRDNNKVTSNNHDEIPALENITKDYSTINDFCLKQDYQLYMSNKQSVRFGGGGILHSYKPGVNEYHSKTDEGTIDEKESQDNIDATEVYLYLEDDFDVTSTFKINAGVHASGFLVQGERYFSIQPRISGRVKLSKNFSVKAGYSQMTQYQHLLTTSSLTQSSDLWVTATKNINPQLAEQYALGFAWFINKNYKLEVEGYYKNLEKLIAYKDDYMFMDSDTPWEEKITVGKGESYGTEFLLRKTQGKFTGWIGYTLSKTTRQFDDLNLGEVFPYKFDRRHDVSLVGNYKVSDKWSFNMTWVYFSGMRITVPTTTYLNPYYDGHIYNWTTFITPNDVDATNQTTGRTDYFESRNNYKLPDYHRLDVTVTRRKTTKRNNEAELTFGITNLYNRLNPTYYLYAEDENHVNDSKKIKYETVTLFPILPTVTYSLTF